MLFVVPEFLTIPGHAHLRQLERAVAEIVSQGVAEGSNQSGDVAVKPRYRQRLTRYAQIACEAALGIGPIPGLGAYHFSAEVRRILGCYGNTLNLDGPLSITSAHFEPHVIKATQLAHGTFCLPSLRGAWAAEWASVNSEHDDRFKDCPWRMADFAILLPPSVFREARERYRTLRMKK